MDDPYEQYMKQAEALFEAGDVVKAGQIWQAVLKREPSHAAARAGLYKVKAHFDARATQDGLVKEPEAVPEQPNRKTLTPATPEINTLLEAGCALYDAGLLAKAISTWEMALQKEPANALAKGYIDGARRKLEADSAPPEPPEAPPEPPPSDERAPEEEIEKLLRDGCTLFDMGQMQDALDKWERILVIDPDHALASVYTNDARKELGLPALARGERPAHAHASSPEPAPEPPPPERGSEASRADQLTREGVQIYDLGMVDEAMEKWRLALTLEPGHPDAPGYLEMARRDREALPPPRSPQRNPAPPLREEPARPAAPEPGSLEARLQAAENLLRNQKFEEAAFAFQILLDKGASDPRVLHGYQQARALLSAREQPQPSLLAVPPPTPPPPVGPPGPSPSGPRRGRA